MDCGHHYCKEKLIERYGDCKRFRILIVLIDGFWLYSCFEQELLFKLIFPT